MSDRKYDLVIYGASGFTGAYVLEHFVKSKYGHLNFAVAGRSRQKLEKTLHDVSKFVGKDLSKTPIIIADSGDEESLAEMAKQTRVIVNVVGPYRLYGEPVVKAAVENSTSHVDISGEPAWLEQMQMKYNDLARQNGVYIVGACGWDSIPCDLGTNFLKQKFDGTLCYAETFAQNNIGPDGYSINSGTYQTLILGLSQMKNDQLGPVRRAIMPEKVERSKYRPPKRGLFWKNSTLDAYALPFMGSDKSVVTRTQYFDAVYNKAYPVTIETYIVFKSWFWASLIMLWSIILALAVKFEPTRKFFQNNPSLCSGGMFKENGPSREQTLQTTFTYWFIGKGWTTSQAKDDKPEKTFVARCDGPDSGYNATAGCVLASAITILEDKGILPKEGGVYTPGFAFKDTKIYERLENFDITFRVDQSKS